MPLTLIGLIVTPAVFLPIEYIILFATFFSCFTATYYLNIESASGGLQIFTALVFASLIRRSLHITLKLKFRIEDLPLVSRISLFALSLLLSLLSLTFYSSNVEVPSPDLMNSETILSSIDASNLVHLLYVLLGGYFIIEISNLSLKNREFRIKLIKTYLHSASFCSLWGILQLLSIIFGIEYPTLFNNGISDASLGYLQSTIDTPRISSVASEPSTFAIQILIGIGLLLPSTWNIGSYIFSKRYDYFLIILFASVVYASDSSIGILGLIFLFSLRLLYKKNKQEINFQSKRIIYFLLIIISSLILLSDFLARKLSTYSYFERSFTILNAINLFIEYPFFGIGWGEVTSHDLLIRILSNAGIFGAATFLVLYIHLTKRVANVNYRLSNIENARYCFALLSLTISMIVGGFYYYYGFFWVCFSFPALSLVSEQSIDKSSYNENATQNKKFHENN